VNIRGCLLFLVLTLAAAALPSVASAKEGDLRIVRVWPEWRDGKSFKRISEYFTGRENTGGQLIQRTDPARRTGYYFLVRLENPAGPRSVQARLRLILPDSPAEQTTAFTVALRPGANVLNLGLTTAAWGDPKHQPVAWLLQVVSPDDGTVLATEKSYLWDKPAGK
jgi:hypothetical protein